jgi:hypothetical protein
VAQERVAQPGAARRALDETRHVRDRRSPLVVLAEVEDSEIRLEGRERVVGDLRVSRGHGREERRLAGVRQTDEPDVGDEPQFQPEPALLAGQALLGVLRRLVRRRREVDVAQPALAAPGDDDRLADGDEIGQELAGCVVGDRGPRWHGQDEIVAGLAVPLRALTAAAGRGLEVVPVAEVAESRLAGVDLEDHRAAATTVATVRSAPGNVRLAPEGRRAVPAIAGPDPDLHQVEEHRDLSSHGSADGLAGPRGPREAQRRLPRASSG